MYGHHKAFMLKMDLRFGFSCLNFSGGVRSYIMIHNYCHKITQLHKVKSCSQNLLLTINVQIHAVNC
jgi:hypothetical protein